MARAIRSKERLIHMAGDQGDGMHPEELLAGYVEGSAQADDRRAVDKHLATCARCRQEVELARASHRLLASLPELPAPGLAAAGLEGLRERAGANAAAPSSLPAAAGLGRRTSPGRRPGLRPRRLHWDRVALGAGLAAAAGLFLFFVATGLFKQSPTAPSAQGSAVRGLPPVIQRGVSYSPESLRSLAAQLRGAATRNQRVTSPVAGAFGPAETTPAISAAPRVTDRAAVASCLRSAAGVDPSLEPFYLEAAAFQGTPAFIGAFVVAPAATGGQSHLLLVASSESGCQPLYVVRQSI